MYEKLLSALGEDKISHFLFGVCLSLPVALVVQGDKIFVIASLTALMIGIVKEWFDFLDNARQKRVLHNVEFADIIATALGGVYVGAILQFSRT
jgi:NhaP-type Na+/H+ or K+/H+ antiporter